MGAPPHLQVVSPDATPEEVAAIVAAIGAVLQQRRAVRAQPPEVPSGWVTMSRLSSRRIGQQRGPWRLAGRVGRRSRA